MDRNDLEEVTMAAGMGAVMGVLVALALVSETALVMYVWLPISGIIGALAGGIFYRPGEVKRAFLAVASELRGKCAAFHPYDAIVRVVCVFGSGIKKHRWIILVVSYACFLFVVFIASARFTLSKFFPEDGGTVLPSILFVLLSVFGLVLLAEKFPKPSWQMPILARVSRIFRKIGQLTATCDEKLGKYFRLAWHKVVLFGIIGLFATAILPAVSAVFTALLVLMAACDIVITLVLSLASTGRLASMFGALIGVIAGSICAASWSFYPLLPIIVGWLTGALAGRWLYILRCALAYKGKELIQT